MRIRARGGLGEGGGEGETRTVEYGGVLESLVRSDKERSEEQEKRKRNKKVTTVQAKMAMLHGSFRFKLV